MLPDDVSRFPSGQSSLPFRHALDAHPGTGKPRTDAAHLVWPPRHPSAAYGSRHRGRDGQGGQFTLERLRGVHCQRCDNPACVETHMLHEFLTANRTEILDRSRVKLAARGAPTANAFELQNGLPLFFDQLVAILKAKREERGPGNDSVSA